MNDKLNTPVTFQDWGAGETAVYDAKTGAELGSFQKEEGQYIIYPHGNGGMDLKTGLPVRTTAEAVRLLIEHAYK